MIFDLFGKKPADTEDRVFADKVYIRSEGKMRACLQLAIAQPGTVFIAWFSESADTLKDFFTRHGLQEFSITGAHLIDPSQLREQLPVFIEHYPLHAKELALVENWPYKNIPVYSSMDEPLFKHFRSDKMIPLIKLFGMKESESIEHSYVTESIVKGQNKIAAKVNEEQLADSQAAWMELNLGSLSQSEKT